MHHATQQDEPGGSDPPARFRDFSLAIEFCCWVVLALSLLLRFANGPPVTDDQSLGQAAIVALAACCTAALRVYNCLFRLPQRLPDR